MNTKNSRFSIEEFVKLFYEAKIPWISFIIFTAINFYISKLSIDTYKYIEELMMGNFFDKVLIAKFIFSSLAIALVGVPTIFLSYVIINFQKRTQQKVWNKIICLPIKKIDELDATSLTSRVTNDASFVASVLTYLGNILTSFYVLYLATDVLFEKSRTLAVYVIPIVILSAATSFIFGRFTYKIHHRIQAVDSLITKFFNEKLSAIKLIKSSNTENEEYNNGVNISKIKLKAQNARTIYETLWSGYQSAITAVLKAVVLIIGASLIVNGELESAAFIAFFSLVAVYPGNVQSFFGNCISLFRIFGQSQVVSSINNEEVEILNKGKSPNNTLNRNIDLKDVKFNYDKDIILNGVTFDIKEGEHIAIVGKSGSGKSTILKLIEQFYDYTSGSIKFSDEEIRKYNLDEWRKNIGYVSQNTVLLPGSIKDNILYGLDDAKDVDDNKIDEVLKLVNLEQDVKSLQDGIDTFVGDLGDRLSAGQKQRISIARAIIGNPDILILDEATANLDNNNEKYIMENLLSLRNGKTTIVVTHNIATIKSVDKIIVLDSGKNIAFGKHEELIENCSLYKELNGEVA